MGDDDGSDAQVPAQVPAKLNATVAATRPSPAADPLHGVTLEAMVTALAAHYGWPGLAGRLPLRCFSSQPSVASSLKFLRRTPWARAKTESLYLFMLREIQRAARRAGQAPAPDPGPCDPPFVAPNRQRV